MGKIISGCTGAGVLLLIEIKSKKYAIIFLDTIQVTSKFPGGLFSIPGGTVSKKDTNLETTAHRELQEESLNTVIISGGTLKKMPYVEVKNIWPNDKGNFRCYCCHIDSYDTSIFRHNLATLRKNEHVPYDFKEITDVLVCPLTLLDKTINKSKKMFGNIKTIDGFSGRTLRIYDEAKKNGIIKKAFATQKLEGEQVEFRPFLEKTKAFIF